jgi:adenosylcobinamide-GDP ribazoletransferase
LIAARRREAHLALVLLTRLPWPRLGDPVPTLGQAAWAFPLAGLVTGGIAAGVWQAAILLGLSRTVAAGLALAGAIAASGALHEDGLADVADGFGGGATPARKLDIMKDSRLGSYGAIALVLALGLRWALMAELGGPAAIVALAVAARAPLAMVLAVMPPARADGLGRAAAGTTMWRAVLAGVIGLAALGLGVPGWIALRVALAMALAVAILAGIARRQIGGQTGDVLGAMQILAEIAGWLALAVAP